MSTGSAVMCRSFWRQNGVEKRVGRYGIDQPVDLAFRSWYEKDEKEDGDRWRYGKVGLYTGGMGGSKGSRCANACRL